MAENAPVVDVAAAAAFLNPLGIVTNGEQNNMIISVQNPTENNYTIVSASASYHDPAKNWKLVRNATNIKLDIPLDSGVNATAAYRLNSEFRPQDLGLTVWVDLKNGKELTRVTAYNQTVTIVEPAASWFDPQALLLWIIVATALVGGAYAVFQTWFAAPQPKKKRRTGAAKKAAEPVAAAADGKAYDDEWIPQQLKKAKKDADDFTSGGEATSGAEASGTEGKTRRRKSKK